jgi:hydroxymethylglutaryl-CoA lyase
MECVFLNESPRDAMQGIPEFIPTESKAEYINEILNVGFHVVDFGSFVSPKVIPQMSDTAEVLGLLELEKTRSRLSVVVGNKRGAEEAAQHPEISIVGYPFSFSETFLKRNLNTNIEGAHVTVTEILETARAANQSVNIYLSMAFGNPYGDPWSSGLIDKHISRLAGNGVHYISLSDTVGIAEPERIREIFQNSVESYPNIRFGFHLHTQLDHWKEKIDAAYQGGCRHFDGVINGLGGCPMAGPGLVGNLDTEFIVEYCTEKKIPMNIDLKAFQRLIEKFPGLKVH